MKRILVLGAGKSSPFLIRYLLGQAGERNWMVTVADLDPDQAAGAIDGHPLGEAIACDVGTPGRLAATIGGADIVVNLLPPDLQLAVALGCLERRIHMVSPSYADSSVQDLSAEAERQGCCLLMEIGLDPGIDHMASMSLIDRVHAAGGIIEHYESYGSGVPAPDSIDNPLGYAITWDPLGVVRAGQAGAHYLRDGSFLAVPGHRIFAETWPIEVATVGTMEAYPNRDSLAYREIFGLAQARTLIRGTLRHPGWCETWHQIVRLGLTTEKISIRHLGELSFRGLVEMFLPAGREDLSVEQRTAEFLGLEPDGRLMRNLEWLGLFSAEPIGGEPRNATDALVGLVNRRLRLPASGRDMVILLHVLEARFPRDGAASPRRERTVATMIEYGEPGGVTAMARTVGLPAALATRLLLDGSLGLTGCHIPTEPAIYRPVLEAMAEEGIEFSETNEPIERADRLPEHRSVRKGAG